LKVDGTTISPVFEKSTTLYTATVGSEVNTLQIEAIPENLLAQVRGDGEVTLTPGVNNIEIEVEKKLLMKAIDKLSERLRLTHVPEVVEELVPEP